MIDQAAALRHLMRPATARSNSIAPARAGARVMAVASGKGGVGKTNVTVNLAIALARGGARVVVLDGDLGLANVDVVLGVTPVHTLQDVLSGERTLAEVVVRGPGDISIIPGASGLESLANMSDESRAHLIASLAELDGLVDMVLIDTAAGISSEVSQFLAAAPEILVVTTPEPTAITDAYAMIKVACQAAERRAGQSGVVQSSAFHLLVNQANDAAEAGVVARKITAVAREFLHVELDMVGYLPYDRAIPKAVRGQVPVILAYPSAPVSLRFVELARRLTAQKPFVRESESGIINLLRRMAAPRMLTATARGFGDGGV